MKKILITGAGSYIGNSFEKWLSSPEFSLKYEIETLDMQNSDWKKNDFAKYDVVLHLAGIVHVNIDSVTDEAKKKYYTVNTDLAVETAERAKASGVKQFIFMSSMSIYGNIEHITKDTEPRPVNFYGDSKWQADKKVRLLSDDSFKVVVLRPPMIYGKDCKGNYPRLSNLTKRLPFFPKVSNMRSMIYIDNLCEFIRLMIENDEHGVFFPQNKEFVNTSVLVKTIADVCNYKIWITRLLTPFAAIGRCMPGKVGVLCRKVFGNCVYDQEMSVYKDNYNVCTFGESVAFTETARGLK